MSNVCVIYICESIVINVYPANILYIRQMDPKVRKEALLQYLLHMQRGHLRRRLKSESEVK